MMNSFIMDGHINYNMVYNQEAYITSQSSLLLCEYVYGKPVNFSLQMCSGFQPLNEHVSSTFLFFMAIVSLLKTSSMVPAHFCQLMENQVYGMPFMGRILLI